MDTPEYTTKRCTRCGEEKPATAEYFSRGIAFKYGLRNICKPCQIEYNREYVERNRDKVAEYKREYQRKNRKRLAQNSKRFAESNPEKIKVTQRAWKKKNPHYVRANYARYQARKRRLPVNFTPQNWQNCLEYWQHKCAVCGYSFNESKERKKHADHWIPLIHPTCPGTVPENMICLCAKCNHSKNDALPNEWLSRRYDRDKCAIILKRIETYFEWIKQQ